MKKFILLFLFISSVTFSQTNSTANVDRENGIYIFILSTPTAPFIKLGTVKIRIALTGNPKELKNTLLKKAAKEYPEGEAIIIKNIDLDEAEVIKFK